MVTDPVVGQKYWCISQSTESQSYGATEPVEPWQGILLQTRNGAWQLCRFGEAGVPDEDSNASTYVTVVDLYETQQAALEDFIIQGFKRLEGMANEMSEYVQRLQNARKLLDSLET